jgi:hypothetical protein
MSSFHPHKVKVIGAFFGLWHHKHGVAFQPDCDAQLRSHFSSGADSGGRGARHVSSGLKNNAPHSGLMIVKPGGRMVRAWASSAVMIS